VAISQAARGGRLNDTNIVISIPYRRAAAHSVCYAIRPTQYDSPPHRLDAGDDKFHGDGHEDEAHQAHKDVVAGLAQPLADGRGQVQRQPHRRRNADDDDTTDD